MASVLECNNFKLQAKIFGHESMWKGSVAAVPTLYTGIIADAAFLLLILNGQEVHCSSVLIIAVLLSFTLFSLHHFYYTYYGYLFVIASLGGNNDE